MSCNYSNLHNKTGIVAHADIDGNAHRAESEPFPQDDCPHVYQHLVTNETGAIDNSNNAVCPSWVRSPLVEAECEKDPNREGAIKAMSPLSPAAELEEIAGVTIPLYGSGSVYVTRPLQYMSQIHDRKVVDSKVCAALVFPSLRKAKLLYSALPLLWTRF